MAFFAFLAALSLAIMAHEVAAMIQVLIFGRHRTILDGPRVADDVDIPRKRRSTTLDAILLAVFPKRFDERYASTVTDVVGLLRRSGYYYATPGEFYAAAIRDFSQYLLIGAALAVGLVILDMPGATLPILIIYIVLGLRRPYSRLKTVAKRRDDAMKNNMLLGLSVLEALLSVSTGAQTAFAETAKIGGPFCNLLALLAVQIEKSPPEKAVEVVSAHLPNPKDIEANLFLADVLAYFVESRRILSGVSALRLSVHRLVLDNTEERAALVRQRANLFGIFSIVGLLLALILPYMGISF
jgi:hypothetical protein